MSRYFLVPLRFVGEALECEVAWVGETKTVLISTDGTPVEDIATFDRYGRAIRTTNLPSNASDFPYIAESIPNWCYEIRPTIMKNNYWGPGYFTDTQLKGDTAASVAKAASSVYPQNLSGGVYEMVNKFVGCQLNYDYNTLDSTWVNDVLSCLSDSQMNALASQWKGDEIETVKEDLESFIKHRKEEHSISSCEYQIMPEAMWVDVYGYPHVPVYVKYTINQSDIKQNLFNTTFGETRVTSDKPSGFTIGKTYEGIVTYTLTKDSKGE